MRQAMLLAAQLLELLSSPPVGIVQAGLEFLLGPGRVCICFHRFRGCVFVLCCLLSCLQRTQQWMTQANACSVTLVLDTAGGGVQLAEAACVCATKERPPFAG